MEKEQSTKSQLYKNRKWLFFAIGIIVGFVICSFFGFLNKVFYDINPISQTIKHIYQPYTLKKDTVINIVLPQEPEADVDRHPITAADSILIDTMGMGEEDFAMDEVDFAIEDAVTEEKLASDKMEEQKTVKVIFKNESLKDAVPQDNEITSFEIQQWSTPIRNRITYQRTGNVLKVKGLNIDNVEIVFYEGKYFLVYHDRVYQIGNNDEFEKLIENQSVSF